MSDNSALTLRRSTLVDLSLVVSLCAAIGAGAIWTTKITLKLEQLQLDLTAIRLKVDSGIVDRWRGADMKAWVQSANREVRIWTRDTERALGLESGSLIEFQFPNPDHNNGR